MKTHRRRIAHALSAALLVSTIGATASAQSSTVLKADTQFPLMGGQMRLDLTGPPNAGFFIKVSLGPSEFESPWGTWLLDPTVLLDLRIGVLDAAGKFSMPVDIPTDPTLVGLLFYIQAGTKLKKAKTLSNSLVVRIEAAAPSGARQPSAIAVTPDGSRAYVAHDEDGTVSVIDPTHDTMIRNFAVSGRPTTFDQNLQVAIDPEGRHAFVLNPAFPQMTVIRTDTDSIGAQIPLPVACRAVAFKFDATADRVFVASVFDHAVLVYTESPVGTFTQTGSLPLHGGDPAKLAFLPDGRLLVGQHNTLEIEVIDPDDADGDPTVARIPLGSRPLDFAVQGSHFFVPTFTPSTDSSADGVNEVLEFDSTSLTLLARRFVNEGTDYFATAISDQHLVITGTASGTVVIADPVGFTFDQVVELVPGEPVQGVPVDVALVPPPGGGVPDRAYVIDHFRETVRPIVLAGGPPFTLQPEIALALSGQPRKPLNDLTQNERGELLFSSVLFFNGTPLLPNPVSCNTCHTNLFSDSITTFRIRQCQPMFAISSLAPYAWVGDQVDLTAFTKVAFTNHGKMGGGLNTSALADLVAFQQNITKTPVNPFRKPDGTISDAAQRGEALFNGAAQCATCHAAPLWIPLPTDSPTIAGGVGTGLVPANVATLLGLWATAPYLHDGSAPTLLDVLLNNVGDQHGTTSTLDAQQMADLVEFLKTL